MRDVKNTRDHLSKALNSVPTDFALREVRYYILKALHQLEHVEKKRAKAEARTEQTKAQNWNDMIMNGVQNPHTSKRTLDIINNMIAEEQRKLEEIRQKRASAGKADDDLGGELEALYD